MVLSSATFSYLANQELPRSNYPKGSLQFLQNAAIGPQHCAKTAQSDTLTFHDTF